MKQGQVTIFFAIGIVLLIVLVLITYVATLAPPEEPERRASTQAKQYIAQCLDTAMYDSLDTLGKQGGAFFDGENDLGNNIEQDEITVDTDTYTIAYGIRGYGAIASYTGAGDSLTHTLDSYDEDGDGIPNSQDPNSIYRSTIFGTVTLPALCEPDGPNSREQTNTHCGPYAYERTSPTPGPSTHTIQGALTKKLLGDLEVCLMQDVQDRIGDTSIYANHDLTITFGARAIVLDVEFSGAPEANIHKEYPVRLLPLYNYISEQLVLDTRDYRYLFVDGPNTRNSPNYHFGFSFSQELIPQGLLYTFEDTNEGFLYRGTKFSLSFLVEDRPVFTDNDGLTTGDPDDSQP